MRVVIADADLSRRTGIARFLRARGIDVVAEVAGAEGAIHATFELEPDLVIVCLAPRNGARGLELTGQLSDQSPQTRVLVIGGNDVESEFGELQRMGVRGYLRPNPSIDRLGTSIHIAAAVLVVAAARAPGHA